MPVVQVTYVPGVLDGKAAGVQVAADEVAKRALVGLSKEAMKARIARMMTGVSNAIKAYVHLQYETSGNGLAALGQKIGVEVGGSLEPWAPLSPATAAARAKHQGYYVGKGSGSKPLLWSGLSRAIAKQSITKTERDVTVSVKHFAIRFNEATRPVFVLAEIAKIAKAIGRKVFDNLRYRADAKTGDVTKEAAYDDEGAFGFNVGESRPFSGASQAGRSNKGKLTKLLAGHARVARAARLKNVRFYNQVSKRIGDKAKAKPKKRKTSGGFSLRDLRSQLREYRRNFGGNPDEGDQ